MKNPHNEHRGHRMEKMVGTLALLWSPTDVTLSTSQLPIRNALVTQSPFSPSTWKCQEARPPMKPCKQRVILFTHWNILIQPHPLILGATPLKHSDNLPTFSKQLVRSHCQWHRFTLCHFRGWKNLHEKMQQPESNVQCRWNRHHIIISLEVEPPTEHRPPPRSPATSCTLCHLSH
jgi:hypothetical protein